MGQFLHAGIRPSTSDFCIVLPVNRPAGSSQMSSTMSLTIVVLGHYISFGSTDKQVLHHELDDFITLTIIHTQWPAFCEVFVNLRRATYPRLAPRYFIQPRRSPLPPSRSSLIMLISAAATLSCIGRPPKWYDAVQLREAEERLRSRAVSFERLCGGSDAQGGRAKRPGVCSNAPGWAHTDREFEECSSIQADTGSV